MTKNTADDASKTSTSAAEHHDNVEVKADNVVIEGNAMDRFVKVFETSARRWELVVYPAMLAFVILAAYGFFLIYTLSKDIHTLAQGMDPEMAHHLGNMSDSVVYLSENIRTMTRRVDKMTSFVEDISGKMNALENLEPMLVNIRGMNASVGGMDQSVRVITMNSDAMRYEMGKMGQSMRPMREMSDFMPW
jgi:uncharacterized protein YoxC